MPKAAVLPPFERVCLARWGRSCDATLDGPNGLPMLRLTHTVGASGAATDTPDVPLAALPWFRPPTPVPLATRTATGTPDLHRWLDPVAVRVLHAVAARTAADVALRRALDDAGDVRAALGHDDVRVLTTSVLALARLLGERAIPALCAGIADACLALARVTVDLRPNGDVGGYEVGRLFERVRVTGTPASVAQQVVIPLGYDVLCAQARALTLPQRGRDL